VKRFTDTEIWRKPWFMDLTPAEKLAFYYIKDQCDNVGVWTPNFRLAEFIIGTQIDWNKFAQKCNGNIYILENGKWWLVDFCVFQHQDLVQNPEGGKSKALQSYVKLLREHGLYQFFLDYVKDGSMPIERAYGGHTYAPKERVRVREQVREEEERDNTKVDSLITYLNELTGKKYRKTESNRDKVRARLNEGYTEDDVRRVFRVKTDEWLGTDMERYLHFDTLCRPSKFEKYLNQPEPLQEQENDVKLATKLERPEEE
jgi:uncharacterized phage protein (TIGR02220 family)